MATRQPAIAAVIEKQLCAVRAKKHRSTGGSRGPTRWVLAKMAALLHHNRLMRWITAAVERKMLRDGTGTVLFYGLLSDTFRREHRAVAAGRAMYNASLRERARSSYLLRRNTHRLEKGLVAPNRRSVFARDFIEETVSEFEAVATKFVPGEHITAELRWARDVLAAYFSAIDTDEELFRHLQERFENAARRLDKRCNSDVCAPFHRKIENSVSINALEALVRQRRSVRTYLPEPVPRETVDRAIAVALQSPSACNRQPFVFRIFDNPAEARRVAAVPAGTKSYVDGIQAVVVIVGRLRAYAAERDRHAIYVDGSLAAMAFMLALEAQGVGSCAINWGDDRKREHRITQMLRLAPDERVIMMISYGWPDPSVPVPFSAKREIEEARQYECDVSEELADTPRGDRPLFLATADSCRPRSARCSS